MSHIEDIIQAFFPFREPADPSLLTERMEPVFPACDDLVGVGLMTNIPDQFVIGGIENPVNGQRQFHGPQRGSQMATTLGYRFNNFSPDLFGQPVQRRQVKAPDVLREVNPGENTVFYGFIFHQKQSLCSRSRNQQEMIMRFQSSRCYDFLSTI